MGGKHLLAVTVEFIINRTNWSQNCLNFEWVLANKELMLETFQLEMFLINEGMAESQQILVLT
jgi:hypothetical protein